MLELLYAALHSPHGVVVDTYGDFERVRQRLYNLRRETQDPDLAVLSFVASPADPTQLWIVKNDKAKGTSSPGNSVSQPVQG